MGGGIPLATTFRIFCLYIFQFYLFPALPAQTVTTYFESWTQTDGTQFTQVQNELLERIVTVSDTNSNLYIASSTYNASTMAHDLLVSRLTDAGIPAWSQQFNIANGGDILVGNISLDGAGNVLFTGAVDNGANSYDLLTVKFNSSGSVQWSHTWNGTANGYDGGASLATDGSNNIYITGISTQRSA